MKKFKKLVCIFMITILCFNLGLIEVKAQVIKQAAPKTIEQKAKYAIEKYSFDGKYILQSISKLEKRDMTQVIARWKAEGNVFQTINTSVHEECHRYQGAMAKDTYNFDSQAWTFNIAHIINRKTYVVSHKEKDVFKSEKMGKNIPVKLRTFRWGTYVAPGAVVTANQWGPYGLLEEFEAYYYGDKAAYDSYGYLLELPYSQDNWFNYYCSLDGTAFYEFEFFTLRYLIYAKQNNINVYNKIMNDSKFKTVFKNVHNKYKKYAQVQKPARIKEMCTYLNKKGIKANYVNGFFCIENRGRSSGANVTAIKSEMTKAEYQYILNKLIK